MNNGIIDRFCLSETAICVGASFMYGIKVYQYDKDIYFATCDTYGKPIKDGFVNVFFREKGVIKCSEDLLLKVSKSIVDKIFDRYKTKEILQ